MNLELSQKQFRRLLDLVYIGNWILNSTRGDQRFTDYVGGFRISCQYFNNKKDIDTMIEGMKDLIKEIGREPDYKG